MIYKINASLRLTFASLAGEAGNQK